MSGLQHAQDRATVAAAIDALGLAGVAVTALEGGVANRSYRLRAGPRDLVLCIPGEAAAALGADPRSEAAMQALAARAGLAPGIILAGPGGAYVVTEFAEGRAPAAAAMREPATLGRLGSWFARLHELEPPRGLAAVDFGERAAGYLARLAARDPDGRIGRLRRELARRRAALSRPGRLVACHHDPHRRNFIDDGSRLVAVDWEYAGPGDPAADLAACASYHALDADAVEALLDGYGGARAPLRARISALGWIFDCLWFGWNAAAAGQGLPADPAEQAQLAARLGA